MTERAPTVGTSRDSKGLVSAAVSGAGARRTAARRFGFAFFVSTVAVSPTVSCARAPDNASANTRANRNSNVVLEAIACKIRGKTARRARRSRSFPALDQFDLISFRCVDESDPATAALVRAVRERVAFSRRLFREFVQIIHFKREMGQIRPDHHRPALIELA